MNDAGVDFEEDTITRKERRFYVPEVNAPKVITLLQDKYNITPERARKLVLIFSGLCFFLAILIPVLYFFF
jgi:hypothetical protein